MPIVEFLKDWGPLGALVLAVFGGGRAYQSLKGVDQQLGARVGSVERSLDTLVSADRADRMESAHSNLERRHERSQSAIFNRLDAQSGTIHEIGREQARIGASVDALTGQLQNLTTEIHKREAASDRLYRLLEDHLCSQIGCSRRDLPAALADAAREANRAESEDPK